MNTRDDDFRVRPRHIRDGRHGAGKPKSFVGQVMQAAKKAGHTGKGFARRGGAKRRSTFGRGRQAALLSSAHTPSQRVVIMTRVVRHRGPRFRSAPLAKHAAYLKRDGVTRDGGDARMFDARSDHADAQAFAERCEEDRHHFRFTVSPEDAAQMEDLRAFTRELMSDAQRDLGTTLDWIAVDHWNTDNPHVHVLMRGRADDGKDLVISRDYISHGFRNRASQRVTMELGPRSELEVRSALEKDRRGGDDEQVAQIATPILEMPPIRSSPPLEICRGTRSSQAANCRPDRKARAAATVVVNALAVRNSRCRDGLQPLADRAGAMQGQQLHLDPADLGAQGVDHLCYHEHGPTGQIGKPLSTAAQSRKQISEMGPGAPRCRIQRDAPASR